MRFNEAWLREWVNPDLDTLALANQLSMSGLEVDEAACARALTEEVFATERVYALVKQGVPFREAYRRVGKQYE